MVATRPKPDLCKNNGLDAIPMSDNEKQNGRQDQPFEESRRRAQQIVARFVSRFAPSEQAYLSLAYHAAKPFILTPELLNYIRTEFLLNQVDWVAEADLLLSDLCQEIGYEQYAMRLDVRAHLATEMKTKLGEPRMEEIARRLLTWVNHLAKFDPRIRPHDLQAQQWGAMVYLKEQREQAVREMASALGRLDLASDLAGGHAGLDPAEMARISGVITDLAHQLEEYPELVEYAALTTRLLNDTTGEVTRELHRSGHLSRQFQVSGIGETLPSLAKVARHIPPEVTPAVEAPLFIADPAAIHQLPPPPVDFTGRLAEIMECHRLISEGATILGVQGMAGIGKTVLALKLAEGLNEQYPDAQFFLDLKGLGPQPLTPPEAMACVIRAYLPEAKLPDHADQLAAMYRSLLDGKRALLLMDNARNAAQVNPLIPPASCVMIVTSRHRFTLPGLHSINLSSLSPQDSRELLLVIEPHAGNAADEIAYLCGYLPLALRRAAESLRRRTTLPVADFVRWLSEEDRWIRPLRLESSFGLSYSLLGPEMQQRWCELAAFPGGFDASAAARMWGFVDEEARHILRELVRHSMVEYDSERGNYRLHTLLRLFAASLADRTSANKAGKRLAQHYIDTLAEGNRLYLAGGQSIQQALQLFDTQWDNIRQGQKWAAEMAGEDEQAAQLCIDYPIAGADLLSLRQPPRERLNWLQTSLEIAARIPRSEDRIGLLNYASTAYVELGDDATAARFTEESLASARELGYHRGESVALSSLGVVRLNQGQYAQASENLEHSLFIASEIGDLRLKQTALCNLGHVHSRSGDPRKAIEFYEQSLAIAREIGARREEQMVLHGLGAVYSDLGDLRRALDFCEQSLAIARDLGDRRGEALALRNIAQVLKKMGDHDQALALAESALAIFEQTGLPQAAPVREMIEQWRSPALSTFSFETVTLDERGKVIKNGRRKLTARQFIEELGDEVTLEMVEIPSGKFMMGTSSEDYEKVRKEYERYWGQESAERWVRREMPQHELTVSPFFIGKFTITQKQWHTVAGWEKVERDLDPNPSHFKDRPDSDDCPVEQVSWEDAKEFCARLAKKTGRLYRLPSEAEWEYACRAGTTTPFAFGETITHETVNYDSNRPYAKAKKQKSRGETIPVGSLGVANAFGLFDMHGNVWEWCEDVWHASYEKGEEKAPIDGSAWLSGGDSSYRVLRGGSWASNSDFCRSAVRDNYGPDARGINFGFRVVVGARTP